MIKTGGGNAQLYSDLAELQKLKSQTRSNSDEGLRQAAQQFEQLFLNMLLRSMRDANAAFGDDNFMNSSQTKMFQSMYDNQIALEMASAKGIGLTDVLVRQLGGQSEPQSVDLKPLDPDSRQLNEAWNQAAAVAASALLAKAEGQENPPGINLTEEQKQTIQTVFEQQLEELSRSSESQPELPDRFESPEEFVDKLAPLAEKVAAELGVDSRVLLAQAALETGWGKFMVRSGDGSNSNNLFNIKADSRWAGDRAQVSTLEYRNGIAQREQAAFRSYNSYEDSFRDYVDFLKNSPRYQMALESAGDPYEYVRHLQEAGYATDPQYAEKIKNIFDGELLASRSGSAKEG